MPGALKLEFAPLATPNRGVLVLFCEEGLKFGTAAARALKPTGDLVTRAAAADRFKGKNGSALDLVAPRGLDVPRLVATAVLGLMMPYLAPRAADLTGVRRPRRRPTRTPPPIRPPPGGLAAALRPSVGYPPRR